MAGEVSKQDQALVRGAEMVSAARDELDGQIRALTGQLEGLRSAWQGAGASAFQSVMVRWTDQTRRITGSLNDFEENLRASERTYNAADEAQSSTFLNLGGRLG